MKLWGYFRSSAAFRTRIALGFKGLPYDNEFVHLRKAEQRAPEFLARNPQGLIPYRSRPQTISVTGCST